MLTEFRLGNFKAFAETQSVPIRPLTLIFGANSSGKSSILHGLLLGRHIMETGEIDVHHTKIGGDAVDLGGFRNYVHKHDCGKMIGWGLSLDVASMHSEAQKFFSPCRTVTVTVGVGIGGGAGSLGIQDIQLRADQTLLLDIHGHAYCPLDLEEGQVPRLAWRSSPWLTDSPPASCSAPFYFPDLIDGLNVSHDLVRRSLNKQFRKHVGQQMTEREFEMLCKKLKESEDFCCLVRNLFPQQIFAEQCLKPAKRHSGRLARLLADGRVHIAQFLNDLFKLVYGEIRSHLVRSTYLGPLRSYPPRRLLFSQNERQAADGYYAWRKLAETQSIRANVNRWLSEPDRLSTPYEITAREWLDTESAISKATQPFRTKSHPNAKVSAQKAEERIRKALDRHEEAEMEEWARRTFRSERIPDISEPMIEVLLQDKRTGTVVSHRDIGFGISQILPILVAAYSTKGDMHLIEQPEIHVHPALQADLGDVFIQSALGDQKNTFVLETHSEHLVLRVLRRVRETSEGRLEPGSIPVRPEDVSVVFVEATDAGAVIRHLPVTPDGDFAAPWPGGFFAERLEDLP